TDSYRPSSLRSPAAAIVPSWPRPVRSRPRPVDSRPRPFRSRPRPFRHCPHPYARGPVRLSRSPVHSGRAPVRSAAARSVRASPWPFRVVPGSLCLHAVPVRPVTSSIGNGLIRHWSSPVALPPAPSVRPRPDPATSSTHRDSAVPSRVRHRIGPVDSRPRRTRSRPRPFDLAPCRKIFLKYRYLTHVTRLRTPHRPRVTRTCPAESGTILASRAFRPTAVGASADVFVASPRRRDDPTAARL